MAEQRNQEDAEFAGIALSDRPPDSPYNPTGLPPDYQNYLPFTYAEDFQAQQARNDEVQEAAIKRAMEPPEAAARWDEEFLAENGKTIGNAAKPEENTLRGYKTILRQGNDDRDLGFSAVNYPIADAVIVQKCGVNEYDQPLHPAFNPANPEHARYAPFLRNFAILRNALINMEYPDGVYIPPGKDAASRKEKKEDLAHFKALEGMFAFLGSKLSGDEGKKSIFERWWGSFNKLLQGEDLGTSIVSPFMEQANVPDLGIAAMYDALVAKNRWDLPPRDQTAFSDQNMELYCNSSTMARVASAFEIIVPHFYDIGTLRAKDMIISAQGAEEILDHLQLKISRGTEGFRPDIRDERQEMARDLLRSTHALRGLLAEIARYSEQDLNDPVIEKAKDAIQQMSYRVRSDAIDMLVEEGKIEKAQQMRTWLEEVTETRYKTSQSDIPMTVLIDQLKAGIEQAAAIEEAIPRDLGFSQFISERQSLLDNADRMTDMYDEFQHVTKTLRSVASLSDETKAISVEEGRKILKNLKFFTSGDSDSITYDYQDTVVEMSQLLLSANYALHTVIDDALKIDPQTLMDPSIIAATDAAEKIGYRIGIDAVKMLHSQGRHEEADSLQQKVEKNTHKNFRTGESEEPLTELIAALETGLSTAEMIRKGLYKKVDSQQLMQQQQYQALEQQQEIRQPDPVKEAAMKVMQSSDAIMNVFGDRYDAVGMTNHPAINDALARNAQKQEEIQTAQTPKTFTEKTAAEQENASNVYAR